MSKKLGIVLGLVLPVFWLGAGCSATPAEGDPATTPVATGQNADAERPGGAATPSGNPEEPGEPEGTAPSGEEPEKEAPPPGTAAPEPTGPGVKPSQPAPKVGSKRGKPPASAKVPAVKAPLESHSGDQANFYVDTDDYVVWAKPSTHTKAEWEYRVVCFDGDGMQSVAFLKYVFADESEAKAWAKTNDLLIRVGSVVYYKGWLGPEKRDKAGVIEIAKAAGGDYYLSKP